VPDLAKLLIAVGLALAALGILVALAPHVPWLGRLPGDIRIEGPGFRLYLPITTCILLSLAVTLLLHLIGRGR
jgi:Protein of unknown function (DUF2905)